MDKPLHDHALRYFDAVRRHRSIREAARRLGIAPSAINRQILRLEAASRMALFERLPDGMRLTQAGELFARHAIAVLQEEQRLVEEMDALRGLRRGQVTLLAVESLNAAFLPRLVERMAARYPGIGLQLRTAGSNVIPAAVIGGEADVGMAFSLAQHPEMRQVAVGRFQFGVVMRADHALAGRATIDLSACARYSLVLPSSDLSIHSLLERKLRRFRGTLDVVAESGSLELIKQIVLRTGALAFQAPLGLESELASGILVHVPLHGEDGLVTELGIYVRAGRALPVAVDAFIALATDELAASEARSH